MSRHPLLLPTLLLSLLSAPLFSACSDDDKQPQPDAHAQDTATIDQGQTTPDSGVDSTPIADMGDAGLTVPDANLSVCSAECLAEAPFFCVKVGTSCEPCESAEHCLANPHSLGPKCEASFNMCYCDVNADCAFHLHGKVCDDSAFMCSCVNDGDCLPGMKCTGEMAGRKVCEVVGA